MPLLLQLASYTAESGAKYSPHYDSNPWEQHNRREISVLLYLNVGWDAQRHGGCLRIHPEARAKQPAGGGAHADAPPTPKLQLPTVDVAPLAGRIVLFHSRETRHEVMPCTAGERVALTLWVEYAE